MSIGNKTVVNDSDYGKFLFTCIALVDLIDGNGKEKVDIDEVMHWMAQYHPKSFFHNFSVRAVDGNPWKFYVSVALERDNLDWSEKNPDCKYMQSPDGYSKKLPIAISDNSVRRWIEMSQKFLVEVIEIQ